MDIFMEKNQMIKHLGLWIDLQENLGEAMDPILLVLSKFSPLISSTIFSSLSQTSKKMLIEKARKTVC
jgi:hypothetical protein